MSSCCLWRLGGILRCSSTWPQGKGRGSAQVSRGLTWGGLDALGTSRAVFWWGRECGLTRHLLGARPPTLVVRAWQHWIMHVAHLLAS